ncbi:hypothetical protein O3S80_50475 [Streptomyces sp. Lzd4kr]|nr:hypothetical protein [Streptomyces sp. Lzd4kr]
MPDLIRAIPTPGDLARRRPATPLPQTKAPYDRRAWEAAVLAGKLPRAARHLAFVLAHHAGESGQLPAGGARHEAGHLAEDTRIDPRMVRRLLAELEIRGWISRPDAETWQPRSVVRPISLTLPRTAARTEPPSTGEVS